ncbi:hypothetical protein E2562_017581, partial [Oryza meyeriana var. granulata]
MAPVQSKVAARGGNPHPPRASRVSRGKLMPHGSVNVVVARMARLCRCSCEEETATEVHAGRIDVCMAAVVTLASR